MTIPATSAPRGPQRASPRWQAAASAAIWMTRFRSEEHSDPVSGVRERSPADNSCIESAPCGNLPIAFVHCNLLELFNRFHGRKSVRNILITAALGAGL